MMGMRQRRCPTCGKRRPYSEGSNPNPTDGCRLADLWLVVDHQLICAHCVRRLATDLHPSSEANRRQIGYKTLVVPLPKGTKVACSSCAVAIGMFASEDEFDNAPMVQDGFKENHYDAARDCDYCGATFLRTGWYALVKENRCDE